MTKQNYYETPAIVEVIKLELEGTICTSGYNGPINGTDVEDGGDAF